MELLLAHIIKSKKRYNIFNNAIKPDSDLNNDTVVIVCKLIKISLDICWDKLNKYYKTLDLSSTYAAAVILHPAYKWRYFEKTWTKPYQTI